MCLRAQYWDRYFSNFNLYVADLHKTVQCSWNQHADDTTTFYQHTKVPNLHHCATQVNKAISRLKDYSTNTNLALNEIKTKWMLFSTRKCQKYTDHMPQVLKFLAMDVPENVAQSKSYWEWNLKNISYGMNT